MDKKTNISKPLFLVVFAAVLIFIFLHPIEVKAGIETITRQIQASTDDAYKGGFLTFDTSSISIPLNFPLGTPTDVGLRWLNVDIPKNSTIRNAYVEVRSYGSYNDPGFVTIRGFNEDNVVTFDFDGSIRGPQKTTASVSWFPGVWTTDSWPQTPDISSIIQEIVNRDNWNSGNALAIHINQSLEDIDQVMSTWNHNPAFAAELNVEFCPPREAMPATALGWTWSENIGWISFSSRNCDIDGDGVYEGGGEDNGPAPAGCPGAGTVNEYGVEVDLDGYFSGYAWSENIGWLSFNRGETGAPPGSPVDDPCPGNECIAKFNFGESKVDGWARALNYDGGWDGWIKLRGQTLEVPPTDYGITLDTCPVPNEFKGWAWSDLNIGWTSFNCINQGVCGTSDYKVMLIFPPTAEKLNVDAIAGCSQFDPDCSPFPMNPELSWIFKDAEGGDQDAYRVQIDDDTNFDDEVFMDSCDPAPGTCSSGNNSEIYRPFLEYNQTYYWRLKVWNSEGLSSKWIYPPNDPDSPPFPTPAPGLPPESPFTTPEHVYPCVHFSFDPEHPALGEIVKFTDLSECYDSGNNPYPCADDPPGNDYLWDFGDGTICDSDTDSSCRGTVYHAFSAIDNYRVKLFIADDLGPAIIRDACSIWEPVPVSLLPEWKEIIPGY